MEAITHNLSITTLRYVPLELRASLGAEPTEAYLNRPNQLLLNHLENSAEAFASNAVIDRKYALRFCIVNFRTATGDIEAIRQSVAHLSGRAHAELSSQHADEVFRPFIYRSAKVKILLPDATAIY